MKKLLFVAIQAALLSAPAMAGVSFVNGGFENGDMAGWSTSTDSGTAAYVAAVAGQTTRASSGNGGLSSQIVSPGIDAVAGINKTYGGSYGVQVGDTLAWGYSGGGTIYNRIKQTASVTAEALGGPGFLYFAWAAVEEISGHSTTSTPFFSVSVRDDTTAATIYNVAHYETDGGAWTNIGNGWKHSTNTNPADPDGWNVVALDLAALGVNVGDSLTLEAIARDCTPSAHAMYVFLDGFGGTPPVVGVPEPVSMALMGLGLVSMGVIRRRKVT